VIFSGVLYLSMPVHAIGADDDNILSYCQCSFHTSALPLMTDIETIGTVNRGSQPDQVMPASLTCWSAAVTTTQYASSLKLSIRADRVAAPARKSIRWRTDSA
jgi:hypothetical protein